MKKVCLALIPLCLTACDKPDLEIMLKPCCELGEKLGVVKLKVWDDSRATVDVHGTSIVLTEIKSDILSDVMGAWIEWMGRFPDTDEQIQIVARYDIGKRILEVFYMSMGGDKFAADVVGPVSLSKYKMPSETELCIEKITEKTSVSNGAVFVYRSRKYFDYRGAKYGESASYYEKIPAEDAVIISANWDYKNLKSYSNYDDKGLEEHEKDACDVLERLDAYIEKHGWNTQEIVYRDEIGCASPRRVVYLGCDTFEHAMFGYLTLNICDDGRHVLNVDGADRRSVPMSVSEKFGGILYSGTADGRERVEVLYNPTEDMWFARNLDSSGAYGRCIVRNLEPHQVCARKIASVTRIEDDGRVALDIKRSQRASENGYVLEREFVPLTQEQALVVSKSWDYKNLNLYSTGDSPHEADACDAFERLETVTRDLWSSKSN